MSPFQRFYYKFYTPAFLRKAKRIITFSSVTRANIAKHYPFIKNKIQVVPASPGKAFQSVDDSAKTQVKALYTGGREFFLCVVSGVGSDSVITLLKAFSNFKRRQQTNMQLVITGSIHEKYESFKTALAHFKYRNDVLMTGHLPKEKLALVMASAYAIIYPALFDNIGLPLLQAMRCGVPVLCTRTDLFIEMAGSGASYFNASDPDDIMKQMATVFKDELLRENMISEGYEQVAKYSLEKSAVRVREILDEAINGSGIP